MEGNLAEDKVNNIVVEDCTEDDTYSIATIDPIDKWAKFRLDMAINMFNTWRLS